MQRVTILPMERIAFLFAIACVFAGCSTDLDINAPYKNVTVVYGLLDQRQEVQYVKINKAYLGEGDALVYAQIADSNEWADGDITVARVHRVLNGTRVGTFDLEATTFTDREPGVFYAPNQKLYKFVDNTSYDPIVTSPEIVPVYLDQESTYELELVVKGETVSATTTIVDNFSIQGPDQSLNTVMNLKDGLGYQDWIFNWNAGHDGKRYEASYRFKYQEIRDGVVGDTMSITRAMGRVVSSNTSGTEEMQRTLEAEAFYSTIGSSILADPTVTNRRYCGIDLVIDVANDEFHTYLSLTEPVSGIVQDRPTYTNIVNGVGLFGSRYTREVITKRLGGSSLAELVNGQYTGALLFCSSFPQDQGGSVSCP